MRKFTLLLLIILFSLILVWFVKITPFFPLVLKVFQKEIIGISVILPPEIREGEESKILVICKNFGNVNLTNVYSELVITDINETIIVYRSSKLTLAKTLYPLEEKIDEYIVIIDRAGRYVLISKCFTEKEVVEKNLTLEVKEKIPFLQPFIPPAPPIPPPPILKIYKVKFEYPEKLNITQGDYLVFYIKLTNEGDLIKNLRLESEKVNDIDVKIFPSFISFLERNSTMYFEVTINTTYKTAVGKYYLKFNFYSNEINQTFYIELEVLESELKKKTENLLNFYKKLLEDLKKEIADLEIKGKNMTIAIDYLSSAFKHFELAKKFYEYYLYEASLEELNIVKNFASKTILEIIEKSIEKVPEKVVKKIPFIDYRILIIAFLISIIILLIVKLIKTIKEEIEKRKRLEIYTIRLRKLRI